MSTASWELKEKIIVLLKAFMDEDDLNESFLVQFWEPVLIEGRTLLTTRHQPFAISSPSEGLWRYRIASESYDDFYVDKRQIEDELGLLGRVFIHKLAEISPNIEYYTIKEYPQRELALGCQINWVHAFPVLDPSRQSCIGVLEMAWSRERESCDYPHYVFNFPKTEELKILDWPRHSYWQIGYNDEAFKADSNEIKEVLEKVCKACELNFAQTWAVCSDCILNASYTGQFMYKGGLPCYPPDGDDDFLEIWASWHLREGQGLVGQALSSRGLIFCSDITQLSIAEYPLAHFAKYYGFRRSFAICLRSSRTGRRLYVLEFFLPSSLKSNESVINLLGNILGTMKLHFQTFKVASGKDLGEKLPIQVVDYRNGEKYNCYTLEKEPQITTTTSPQSPPGTGIQLGLNVILPHAKRKIADAAEALGVSRSPWPPQNVKKIYYGLPSSSSRVSATIAPTYSHDTMMSEVNLVSIKAKHEDDVIKFELLSSSGLAGLQHEITKRLKLTGGTYDIKYKDEDNDLVLITCDEDVRYWIRTCRSQDSNSLEIFLTPK